MALEVSPKEFADAAVVVLIDQDGSFRWSSHKSPVETANALRDISDLIEEQEL